MTGRLVPIKAYEADRKRFHLVQARLELLRGRKLTQADAFRWMLGMAEAKLGKEFEDR